MQKIVSLKYFAPTPTWGHFRNSPLWIQDASEILGPPPPLPDASENVCLYCSQYLICSSIQFAGGSYFCDARGSSAGWGHIASHCCLPAQSTQRILMPLMVVHSGFQGHLIPNQRTSCGWGHKASCSAVYSQEKLCLDNYVYSGFYLTVVGLPVHGVDDICCLSNSNT